MSFSREFMKRNVSNIFMSLWNVYIYSYINTDDRMKMRYKKHGRNNYKIYIFIFFKFALMCDKSNDQSNKIISSYTINDTTINV